GMGTACTRADERVAATLGILHGTKARYECCRDVIMGGVLTGLPALCGNKNGQPPLSAAPTPTNHIFHSGT
ncbi:MAG: hypothetical protein ABIF71_06490, partial [Planctomycetota bacterium]